MTFRGPCNFQNGLRGLWQFKTVLGKFKTVVENSGTFKKGLSNP